MKQEYRTIIYDEDLKLEAYRLQGIIPPFPNHFHDYYVIGYIAEGARYLSCKNREYTTKPGDIILFNPSDNHRCAQSDHGALDYRALNIPQPTMQNLISEISGSKQMPIFTENVIRNKEILGYLEKSHSMILDGSKEFEKEEDLVLLISALLKECGQSLNKCLPECRAEIVKVCEYMDQHYKEHILLAELCNLAGLSKSTLLRAFTRDRGITPYRYLETVRINAARKLLEQGMTPLDTALETGFSDQAHFTNYFTRFIGLAPGVYREIFLH